jgi:hypothetical protein
MIKHTYKNILDKKRILEQTNYIFSQEFPKIKLMDPVVSYYNGINWKIIPLDILLSYPVIHDKYTRVIDENQHVIDITLVLCPFTLATCAFEGKFYPTEYVHNSSLVIKNDLNDHVSIISSEIIDGNKERTFKRFEAEIFLFRNAISDHPDALYLKTIGAPLDTILPGKYYTDNSLIFEPSYLPKFHPKTLVYLLQYKSSKTGNYKYTVIVGKNASKKEISGYNNHDAGYYKYITESQNKITEKNGFIIPMLWFAWKLFFPNAKVIHLD